MEFIRCIDPVQAMGEEPTVYLIPLHRILRIESNPEKQEFEVVTPDCTYSVPIQNEVGNAWRFLEMSVVSFTGEYLYEDQEEAIADGLD